METEEEERKPLKEIKILKLTHKKRYDLGYNSEMVDENDEHRHSQGSSTVKKKMPHYGYQSLMHSAESRFHKRYMWFVDSLMFSLGKRSFYMKYDIVSYSR